ncbi:IPT/TIG domain-containing protein [Pseudobacter ginsenosidimutans]|uniref:IPT/TIG domain-containing protein n=1 Tax=Pseudobacter ginsenosidimutans TaxID=661488 RepID=A0A4Q7MW84_9BACT|nr:IPT/TIG domain-containing protein [Pseudobacter ginsenosidimutans]QEC40954.1 hypothetical protein FSB84_04315 [Pseudobacter ginsenosidimutans]RZS72304.1 IPT/TIG domain-containing protein [Pseudobacter ginsenosidimutans]
MKKTTNILSLILLSAAFAITSCKKDSDTTTPKPPPDTTLKISSLSSTSLHYGDTIAINGNNFSPTPANNIVTINNVAATVFSATITQLKVIVPAVGNSTGEVKIIVGSQTASGGEITYSPDVFVAGGQYNPAHNVATLWKNGTAVSISTEESALTSIFLNGNDIYVAGVERINNLSLANYWKNGNKVTLGTGESVANGIAVNGNDVYVGGAEIVNGFDLPRYWKNGTGTTVTVNDPIISQIVSGNGACTGVYINAGNVITVGSYRNSQGRFSPWECKNGIIPANTIPNNDKHCFANAVFVSGADVYEAGSQNNPTTGLAMASIWKNGTATTLTSGTVSVGVATAVFVVGNDIYVAGYEQEDYYGGGSQFAKYWKNGVPVKLSNVSSGATGITVFGNDVYVSGWEHNGTYIVSKYWKNGVAVNLGKSILTSTGSAIAVR